MPINQYEEIVADMANNNQLPKTQAQQTLGTSMYLARDKNPEIHSDVLRLSNKLSLPTGVVERNYKQLKEQDETSKIDYANMQQFNPGLLKFLENPDNAAIAKDDLEPLGKIERATRLLIPAKETDNYPGQILFSGRSGFNNLESAALSLYAAYGKELPEGTIERLAEVNKRQQEMASVKPEYVKEFEKNVLGKEMKDVQVAFDDFLDSFETLKNGDISKGLKQFLSGEFKTAGESLDFIWQSISRPKALGYTIAEQLPYMLPALTLGFTAGKAGGVAGVATGSVAGSLIPGVGTVAGGGVGGAIGSTLGFMSGTFTGSALVEIGSTITEMLGRNGIDTTNPEQLRGAFRNPEIMKEVISAAQRKGLTTAAVDALFSAFAGKFFKAAPKTASVTKKAVEGAKDIGVQSFGEFASELSGSTARDKKLSGENFAEALFEGVASLGSSVGEVGAGSLLRDKYSKDTTTAAKELTQDVNTALETLHGLQALQEAGAAIQEAKTSQRLPEKIKELVDASLDGEEASHVYFQTDEWDSFWNEQDKSPTQAADEILEKRSRSYYEAKENGHAIEMPMSEFLQKLGPSGYFNAVLNIVRLKPDGMTAQEAGTILSETNSTLKQLAEEAETQSQDNEAYAQGAEEVRLQLKEQMISAGLTEEEAQAQSVVLGERLKTRAALLGIDARELFKKRPLEIRQGFGQEQGTGTFNQSLQELAPPMYSKLIRTIEQKMPNSASPQQIQGIIKEIKPEERKWLGIDEFLKSKEKLSKQEVLKFLKANELQVQEIIKGDIAQEFYIEDFDGKEVAKFDTSEEAEKYLNENSTEARQLFLVSSTGGKTSDTKYSQYTLLGGENYKELLLTLPTKQSGAFQIRQKKNGDWIVYNSETNETESTQTSEYLANTRASMLNGQGPTQYISSHWDEANILAFVRMNDRVDSEGNKVLFLEEVQSDWHQAGRKRGYKGDETQFTPDQLQENKIKRAELADKFNKRAEEEGITVKIGDASREGADLPEDMGLMVIQYDELWAENRSKSTGVPDAPFRKTWHEFAMKRILRMAAEGGYDKVAWTTGEQQAERYDLSKKISEVHYSGTNLKAYDMDGNTVINQTGIQPEELDDYIGKEAAKKLLDQKPNGTLRSLVGQELKVGGEGMKGFYDQIIPKFLNKFGKKYDVKTKLDNTVLSEQINNVVHSIEVTDKLKEAALSEGFTLFQDGEGDPRARIQLTDTKAIIELGKARDASSLIHEAGHLFLDEVASDYNLLKEREAFGGELTPAQEKFIVRADALLKWFGVDSFDKVTSEHHEMHARGFEKFMAEGKAPTPELSSVFAQFKVWILSVYRTLKNLKVKLTPEVRDYFAHLIASEEAIASARTELVADYPDAKAMGLTGRDAEQYNDAVESAKLNAKITLDKKLIEDFERTRAKWWKETLAKYTQEELDKLNNNPIYVAISVLQNGKKPDGTELVGVPPIKLSRADVKAIFGDDAITKLPRGITTLKGGVPVSVAAELFGFPSAESFLGAIASAPKPKESAAMIAEGRMREEFPSLMATGQLESEALNALRSDKESEVLRLQLQAILKQSPAQFLKGVKQLGGVLPSTKAIKNQAQRILLKKPGAQIKPNIYLKAKVKYAKEAARLYSKGDFEGAFEAKRKELLNYELYLAATVANEKRSKFIEFSKKLFKKDSDLAKSRDMDLINAARSLLAIFDIGPKNKKSPQEYLAPIRSYDEDTYSVMVSLIDTATQAEGNIDSITHEEFLEVERAVRALWSVAKSNKEIEIGDRKRQKEDIINDLSQRISEVAKPRNKTQYNKTKSVWDKAMITLLGMRAALRRVEPWVEAMDGGSSGFFREYIWNPVKFAIDEYRVQKETQRNKFAGLVKLLDGLLDHNPINAPELKFQFKNTSQLIGALLHIGNSSNLQKLLRGYKWGDFREDGTLDTTKWDAFLARAFREGIIKKEHMDFVQGVWDLLESFKSDTQKAHKKLYGHYFAEITAEPVQTPWGEYNGGYMPAKADPYESNDAFLRQTKDELDKNDSIHSFPTTGRGATKSRVQQYAAPLSLDLGLVQSHIDWALRFTYIEPAVKQVGRIFIDKTFNEAMSTVDETVIQSMLIPWLTRSAQQRVVMPVGTDQGAKGLGIFAKHLRTGTGLAFMSGNFVNTMQQYTGVSIAKLKVKNRYLRTGLVDYITSPRKTAEMIAEKSKFMSTRTSSSLIETQNQIDDILLDPSWLDNAAQFAKKHAYFMQTAAQNQVDLTVWLGAYHQSIAEGMSEDAAVRFADSTVRQTQGSFDPEDISRIETGNAFVRLFTQFAGYFNMQANLFATEYVKKLDESGFKTTLPRGLYIYFFGFMIPAVISEAIVRGFSGEFDEDDDDEYLDDALKVFFEGQVRSGTALVPFAGQVAQGVYNAFDDKWYNDRLTISPSIVVIETLFKVGPDSYKAITEGKNKSRAIKDVLTLLTVFTKVPFSYATRPLGYLADVQEGRAKPEDPIDFTRGLLSGRPGK